MNKREMRGARRCAGFSLVELMVVLLIFAILMAIAVPSLMSTQPERNLAAAGDLFANDFNYMRAKAEATGNNVYLMFEHRPDSTQIEGRWDPYASPPAAANDPASPTTGDPSFDSPCNPGVSRVARSYVIVEERGRYHEDGAPYTYLDWLNDYDDFNDGIAPYPVEPQFPYSITDTLASGTNPDPAIGAFNDIAAPLVAYPMDMTRVGQSYEARFRSLPADLSGTGGWSDGELADQQFKVFCVADEAEILWYDQNADGGPGSSNDADPRTYDPVPGGTYGGWSGSEGDHPRLLDQVVDYVVLKRVELPEYVYFLNPWKNTWVLGWEDTSNGRDYAYEDMQFLQYLWKVSPGGEIVMCDWGFEPEPFPSNSYNGLVHGNVVERQGVPATRMMWMVIEECVDFGANSAVARAMLLDNKKSNQTGAGRMFCFWPLNGKYYVSDYTPNDGARQIDPDDPRLNLSYNYSGTGDETDEMPLVAREYGYSQNFLVPPGYMTGP